MTKWLSRFLIFLLVIIVAISVGLSIYYFLRNDEVFSLSENDNDSLIRYVNVGETIDITVTRINPSSDAYSLVSSDDSVVKFEQEVRENVFRFTTLSGGSATLKLETANTDFQNLYITVNVGDGSTQNPFYIRNYKDLSSIGTISGMDLSKNYLQTADIDMSVATTAWTPIALNEVNGFTGSYNGNGHSILNLSLVQDLTPDVDSNPQAPEEFDADVTEGNPLYVDDSVKKAGLFATIGYKGVVSKLNFKNAVINGAFESAGVVSAVNHGTISFVNVQNSNIIVQNDVASVGGVSGIVYGNNGEYSAKLQYVSFDGKVKGGLYVGGLAGQNRAGLIFNSYSKGKVESEVASAIAGGIVGQNTFVTVTKNFKSAVVNNYTISDVVALEGSSVGAVIGKNINTDNTNGIVLKPDSENTTQMSYNRIYGNYFLFKENVTINGVGGIETNATQYIANGVLQSALMTAPTIELINELNAEGADFNADLAFISYSADGKYTGWNFNVIWNIDADTNNNYPFIRNNASPVSDAIYNGDEFITPPTPIDPEQPEEPVDPDAPIDQAALLGMFEADLNDDGLYNGNYLINRDVILTEAWTPVGDLENPFNGKFYVQQGIEIRNLIINDIANTSCYGFFGVLGKEAEVNGLTIKGVKINLTAENTENHYVGAVAGLSMAKGFNNIEGSSISVIGVDEGDYNTINVENKTSNIVVGGVVGQLSTDALMNNTTSNVNISVINSSADAKIKVGGLVGWNLGKILTSGVNGKEDTQYITTIDVSRNTSPAVFVGGVAGVNEFEIADSYFKGKVIAANATGKLNNTTYNVSSGGIAGANYAMIERCGTDASISGGYYAGGIAGVYKVTSSLVNVETSLANAEFITQSYATGSVSGHKVGGFTGITELGTVSNCYNTCALSGKVMGGYTAELPYKSGSNCGKIKYCYSSATFDISSGKAYWETSSTIRQTTSWLTGQKKLAGYVENCIYNTHDSVESEKGKINSIERQYHYFFLNKGYGADNDGRTSDANCKLAKTFTNRGSTGFSTSIWNLADGVEPTLKYVNF